MRRYQFFSSGSVRQPEQWGEKLVDLVSDIEYAHNMEMASAYVLDSKLGRKMVIAECLAITDRLLNIVRK